mgnify:CR=1 FL=1
MRISAHTIFLIDGIGALVTALLLSQVLTRFESFFGMPSSTLWVLAAIAFCFSIYSFVCQFIVKKHFKGRLATIIIANTLYCVVTTALMIAHFDKLTVFGLAYFIGEIFVILLLVLLEYTIFKRER